MREQEFRARDKVVQKMSRGGLQEKNLTKGTEQGISQRDGDFSFQVHGEEKWEEDMAGRAAPRGRESPSQDRNVFSRQTERDGEPYGGSRAAQDMDERHSFSAVENSSMPEPLREHGESHSPVFEGRREGRYSAQPDTIRTMRPDQPVQDRRAAGSGQGRKAWREAAKAGTGRVPEMGKIFQAKDRRRMVPGIALPTKDRGKHCFILRVRMVRKIFRYGMAMA